MAVTDYLSQLLVLVGVAVVGALLLVRLRLPVVTVLLVAGAFVGPAGLGFVSDVHDIEILAHIGVVLLLFTIGLEFSIARLIRIGRLVALGGSLQVGLTIAAVTALAMLFGDTVQRGIFMGFVIALSSTAIVLRSLSERGEVDAPHGRFILGALLFQDLAFVPMMLLVPVLAGQGEGNPFLLTFVALAKAAVTVVITFVVARVLVPRLLAQADRAKSREVFLLTVLSICIGTAWATSLAGLSLELGAFLAGIVLADSEYAHRAEADIMPLRDVLTSLFFMSLGMLFDVGVLRDHPGYVIAVFAVIFFGKSAMASLASLAMRMPARVAVLAGIGLAQFGEFGFVVAQAGAKLGLMEAFEMKVLFTGAILTMILTPIAIRLGPFVAAGAARIPGLSASMGAPAIEPTTTETAPLEGHVVIVGFGVAGRTLAAALKESETPYLILELNADTVRQARAEGEPAFYGDIGSTSTMHHARVAEARALVLLINDQRATERAVVAARHQAPTTPVFVRTKFLSHAAHLQALGASEVVVEEVEAGLEMLARCLSHAGIPRNLIMRRMEIAREHTMAGHRRHEPKTRRLGELAELEELGVDTLIVGGSDYAVNRSVVELELRLHTGANLVALRRAGALIERDLPSQKLQEGDILFLVGSVGALRRALHLLESGDIPEREIERSSRVME